METIKKKFLASTSKPIVVGENIAFRILIQSGAKTYKLPIRLRDNEICTVDWGNGLIKNYLTGINIMEEITAEYDYYSTVIVATNLDTIQLSSQVNTIGNICELISWGKKPIVNEARNTTSIFADEIYFSNIADDEYSALSTISSTVGMFSGCTNLVAIPNLDTSNCTHMANMFSNNPNLTTVEGLDLSSVGDLRFDSYSIFGGNIYFSKLHTIKLKNLGKGKTSTIFDFRNCPIWSKESMLYTAENSFDLISNGSATKTIKLYSLSGYEEPISIWKIKGYSVV